MLVKFFRKSVVIECKSYVEKFKKWKTRKSLRTPNVYVASMLLATAPHNTINQFFRPASRYIVAHKSSGESGNSLLSKPQRVTPVTTSVGQVPGGPPVGWATHDLPLPLNPTSQTRNASPETPKNLPWINHSHSLPLRPQF